MGRTEWVCVRIWKVSGVVKVRVTSSNESARQKPGGRGIEDRLSRMGSSSDKTHGPFVPTGRDTGMVKSRVTSTATEAGPSASQLCSRISSRFEIVATLRKPQAWKAWAAGRGLRDCPKAKEVGRGEGQGYFADTREDVSSNPT